MRLTVQGAWPGSLILRRRFARAEARPWNADLADAQLRVVRGGRSFLRSCTDHVLREGAPSVVSPPLAESSGSMWRDTGYLPYRSLDLWRHDLRGELLPPDRPVEPAAPGDCPRLLAVDRAAFDPFWRLDGAGLREAREATPRSRTLVIRSEGGAPVGYAVVGISFPYAYLQRLAVHPGMQGSGRGRSLLRAGLAWARSSGATALLLNTQPNNWRAARLYASEGLRRLPSGLQLFKVAA